MEKKHFNTKRELKQTLTNNLRLKQYRKYLILLAKLLGFYLIVYILFRGYVGIIDSKGPFYSPFLHSYSLLQLVLNLIIFPTKFLLELLGYHTRFTADTIGILGGNGVHIAYPCLGIELMIAFLSLFFAFPGIKKIPYLILGIIGIHCLNIVRVFSIILFNKSFPQVVDLTHTLFNLCSYVLIFSLFYFWYKKYSKDSF